MDSSECFVVMPFGVKSFPDGSGRTYDFDKVYRVICQRAINEAGMKPIRADERVTSAIIHSEMFRDLRDRLVVLADLSLDNPNVFYELGIRHVMSSNGTVLMCRKGSVLPFDVKLSRVIFYDFDGASLDWEEVERVVGSLKVALQEAHKGHPDSPVHALLETVLRADERAPAGQSGDGLREDAPDGEPLMRYQKLVADCWRTRGESPESLFKAHRDSIFGSRALAYHCLDESSLDQTAKDLAHHLNDGQQYRLANELFSRLKTAGQLSRASLLAYASSYSEAHPDLAGADQAIALVEEALKDVEREFAGNPDSRDAVAAYAACHYRLAGLYQWSWRLSRDAPHLDRALAAFEDAIRYNDRARVLGVLKHPGMIAQQRLKQLLLLRIRDQNIDRQDSELHRDAILEIQTRSDDDPKGLSYLGWFQAITLADMGYGDRADRKALTTYTQDAKVKLDPAYFEVGRRQYVLLRRFLAEYAPYLRNPSLIGRLSQLLQAGLQIEASASSQTG
jgi:tetratricopeptide (TPR) repeat protein